MCLGWWVCTYGGGGGLDVFELYGVTPSCQCTYLPVSQAPYMMDQWRKGADPGEVECLVQYKVRPVLLLGTVCVVPLEVDCFSVQAPHDPLGGCGSKIHGRYLERVPRRDVYHAVVFQRHQLK